MLYILSQPGFYVVLGALISSIIPGVLVLINTSNNNNFQLKREEQQRIWQEKSDEKKWYREKIYDCYRTAAQLVPKIFQQFSEINLDKKADKIVSTDKTMNLLKLTSEFSCEFSILIAGHPDKNSTQFKEKITKINKSLNEEPWNLLPMITEMMEHDPRIKNINK